MLYMNYIYKFIPGRFTCTNPPPSLSCMLVVYPSIHPSFNASLTEAFISSMRTSSRNTHQIHHWHAEQFGLSSQPVVHVSGLKKSWQKDGKKNCTEKLHKWEWEQTRIRHGTPTLSCYMMYCTKPCTTMPSVHKQFLVNPKSYTVFVDGVWNIMIPFLVVVRAAYGYWCDAKSSWGKCWPLWIMNTNNLCLMCIYSTFSCLKLVCACVFTHAHSTPQWTRETWGTPSPTAKVHKWDLSC